MADKATEARNEQARRARAAAFDAQAGASKQASSLADQHFRPGESRADFLARIGGGAAAPERKVNMQTGMGNTNPKQVFAEKPSVTQGMLASNPLDYIKKTPGAMQQALGYGTSLLSRGLANGNSGMVKTDYIDRLKGSDVFRKLDSASQGHVLKAYQDWLNTQSAFNENKRNQVESQRQLKQNLDEGANYGEY
jgi:hypothetical protein